MGGSYKADTWGSSQARKYRLIGMIRKLGQEAKSDYVRLEAFRLAARLEGFMPAARSEAVGGSIAADTVGPDVSESETTNEAALAKLLTLLSNDSDSSTTEA